VTGDAAPPGVVPRPPARIRRRALPLIVAGVAFLLLTAGAALAAFRYVPALDEAHALRSDLETMVQRVREAGLEVDRATMDALEADLVTARGRFGHLSTLLASDPLVALARLLPPTSSSPRPGICSTPSARGSPSAVASSRSGGRGPPIRERPPRFRSSWS